MTVLALVLVSSGRLLVSQTIFESPKLRAINTVHCIETLVSLFLSISSNKSVRITYFCH